MGTMRASLRKSTTSGAVGADPVMHVRTLPPSSFSRKSSMTACDRLAEVNAVGLSCCDA